MSSSTLVKTLLHNSVADSVYNEISTKSGRYYYFLGSVLDWVDPLDPPTPVDSFNYEKDTRKNIVLVKEIQPSDVAYVIDRINWQANAIYDIYDDNYCDQVIGIDLIAGGSNYSSNATVTISGGGGVGATANLVITDGAVTSVNLLTGGSGYTTKPNVTINHYAGTGAVANAVINYAYSGAANLQSSIFYVVTDDFNIYKCLDNNNNSRSTIKPTDTTPESFTLSDGYKWKFMGNVPIYLRNKFLTLTQIPVTTSISRQFYSSGEIKKVEVVNTGNNYTYARIAVQGDGYQADEPYVVVQSNIVSGGASYTSATVTIDPPISGASSWAANTSYNVGKILKFENNIYEVVKAGTTASHGPVHTKDIYSNGTVGLKFRGTQITANANISGGSIVGLTNFNASIRNIQITNGGSGYINPPSITVQGGGGVNAAAYSNLTDNTVTRIVLLDSGKNFTHLPNVIIGTQWTANSNVTLNSQVFYNTRLYTVTTAGTTNTTAPTHTFGTQTLGTANLTYAGLRASAVATLKYGSGYTTAPNVVVTGDGTGANILLEAEKTEAVLYPYIDNGKITHVLIEDGGIGYTYATLTVVGDGANAEFDVNFSQGDLESLQSTSELLAPSGAIHTIQVVSGGYNYTGANVTIIGDGTGATANATIRNGKIVKINLINEGLGYTQANVVITGTGVGATARAIMSPYGGHGKDTVSELFARSLAFYTTIGQEKNQGFVVQNDYRQFGIIKNIRNYFNSKYYSGSVGSGCWLMSGNVNTSLFTPDTIITKTTDNSKYLIVSSDSSGMIVLPLSGTAPTTLSNYFEPSGNGFYSTGIVEPDVDKYSGELLYIDNRLAFTTTEDQSVSIKTVFKY